LLYPTELPGLGAGWGSRNPTVNLENLHTSRYTNPATEVIISQGNLIMVHVSKKCVPLAN